MTASVVARARAFIVLMGVVSMFGDMTYQGARGLVGPYLDLLGASATTVGFVAGLGELVGYGLRVLTGWLADRTRAYWPMVIAGYAVNLVAVPALAWVGDWRLAVALVILERVGKAVRSPARSTLVSYAAHHVGPGTGFAIDEALDQIGAVIGPLLTALVMWVARDHALAIQYQLAFAVLLLPVIANLVTVVIARRRYPRPDHFEPSAPATAPRGAAYRWYLVAVVLVGIGFADWALIAFHAGRTFQLDAAWLPVFYAGAMALDAVAALLAGLAFDRRGIAVLAVTTLVAAAATPLVFLTASPVVFAVGAATWAIGMGAQESIFKAAIATLVPKDARARAYGTFFAAFGVAWWLGSTAMGWLYDRSLVALAVGSTACQLAAVPLFAVVARRARPVAP